MLCFTERYSEARRLSPGRRPVNRRRLDSENADSWRFLTENRFRARLRIYEHVAGFQERPFDLVKRKSHGLVSKRSARSNAVFR